mgnify:CR=1 FL=1
MLESFVSLATEFGPSILVAALLLTIVLIAARGTVPLLVMAIVVALPLGLLGSVFLSSHIFLHSSIVYQIANGVIPPLNPLLAGEPIHYAWLHHALIAAICQVLALDPLLAFSLLNVVCLLISMYLLSRLGYYLCQTRLVAVLSALFGLCAASPLMRGPLRFRLKMHTGFSPDTRVYPLVKYITINSNGLGLACASLMLFSLVSIYRSEQPSLRMQLLLFLSIVGIAHFYPIIFPVSMLVCIIAIAVAHVLNANHAVTLRSIATLCASAMLSLPYLLHLGSGRVDQTSFVSLDLSMAHLTRNGLNWMAAMCITLPLIIFYRSKLIVLFKEHRSIVAILGSAVIISQLYHLLVHQTDHTEYKALALSFLAIGPLLAVLVQDLYTARRVLAVSLMLICLIPSGAYYAHRAMQGNRSADPFATNSIWLEALDRDERALHHWIRDNTEPNDPILDTHLSIPAFTGRPLYVGLDLRRRAGLLRNLRDGWNIPAATLLAENFASDPTTVQLRRQLAQEILILNSNDYSPPLTALREEMSSTPVYLVSRAPELAERWLQTGLVKSVFRSGLIQVVYLNESIVALN